MSLINQMLQDLDARGTHASSAGVMQGQIRVVPERSGMRIAAAVAVALLILAALAAGFWWWQGRTPVAPAPASMAPVTSAASTVTPAKSELKLADFSLKMAPDLNQVPLPEVKDMPPAPAGQVTQPALQTADSFSSTPARPEPKAPLLAANASPETGAAATRNAPAPARGKIAEPGTSVMPDKQVKDLTPQQNAENAYRNGATLLQQGRVQEAGAALEQALQLDPGNAAARQTLVAVLIESKRKDEAIRRLREGLQLDPGQAGLAMILARLQVDRGETATAIDTLQKSLPHAGERGDYPAFLAALLQREARHKEAIEQYNAALRRSPQNGVWWMGLGISLQAEHRLADAADAYARAKAAGNLSADLRAFVEEKLVNLQR